MYKYCIALVSVIYGTPVNVLFKVDDVASEMPFLYV